MIVTQQSWIHIKCLPYTTAKSRHTTFHLESETRCTVLIPSNIYLTQFYREHVFTETARSTARKRYAPLKYIYLKMCILVPGIAFVAIPGTDRQFGWTWKEPTGR